MYLDWGFDFREELELGFSVIDESGVGNSEDDCLGGKFHHEIEYAEVTRDINDSFSVGGCNSGAFLEPMAYITVHDSILVTQMNIWLIMNQNSMMG